MRYTLSLLGLILFLLPGQTAQAQIDARMFQYPDVSATHISFVYAGDIWVVPKEGGQAGRLSSPDGSELFPKFSPDGKTIAFSGNYNGNYEVYTIPVLGGIPKRLSSHDFMDRVLDWTPDGSKILFSSSRESGKQRFSQFYLLPVQGGIAEKMPLAYGEMASFSPDGGKLVFTERSQIERTWKRYRGGMATDLVLFDLKTLVSEVLAPNDANDEIPMWVNDKIWFLSDRGPEMRYNIWSYNPATRETKQITSFSDYDIHFPSAGPSDIVFEAGGKLYLLNVSSGQYREVKITVVTDMLAAATRNVKVAPLLNNADISPDGKRVVVEARGELFSVPAEFGYVKNLSRTSGFAERYPAWSPDGKTLAYWSDRSGEYELTLFDLESNTEKKITSYGAGFRYNIFWSPDSKKLVFVDQTMSIKLLDVTSGKTVDVDKDVNLFQGGLQGFTASWSPDSRWITYGLNTMENTNVICLFDTKNNTSHRLTSGFYADYAPVFDPEGKYIYFLTNRSFNPLYGNFDNSWIYANSTRIAVVTLRADVKSPLDPRNDEVSVKSEEKKDEKAADNGKAGKDAKKDGKDKKEEVKPEVTPVEIDIAGFESRIILLPPDAGNIGRLQAAKGKVVFLRGPNTGSSDRTSSLRYFEFEKREEKTVLNEVNDYQISFNGEKVLVMKGQAAAVVSLAPDQKMDKPLRLDEMEMTLVPQEEWKQIFNDAWRIERDFFYDKNMHGLDWNAIKEKYGKLLDMCVTRWDVNFVLGDMIGEMNASHTYRGGGDTEQAKYRNTGYLGIDWELSQGAYRIKKIIKAAPWETEVRSPLALPGVNVKEGEYILAVNGEPLDISQEPYAAFGGLAGKTIELTVNATPSMTGARKILVEALGNEARLRNLAWIENNRKRVEEATGGQVGYVYVPSTGVDGQTELVRQFMAQWSKAGLIIDERFNDGGQIPDRFIELLNRKPLAYWAVRDGKDWQWPPVGHFGPSVMLINGWSGSGGDAFPDFFRKAGLGPLIGARTWGGLIGISGCPNLIDGGSITVPTFRMYDPDGKWFKEGHGVDPDIEVREDPTQLAKGVDNQLEKAIEVIMNTLKTKPYVKPDHPAYEKR
jgi:tricorn protease